MLQRIDHVNIVVDDLEAMTAFYRDVLGMHVAKEVTIGGPWIQAVTGLQTVEADVVYLEADSGAGLELILYRTPEGIRPSGLGDPNTKGLRHIAFRVADLEAVVASLRTEGADLLSDVQKVPASQVDFAGQQKRIVYCRDPEGNLLEVCDFR
jgi:catechol 2,3-dioxygenase-like lactoylglutathione lyase family enzyme